eukprot:TRINITY_DN1356_c0_g1_i1.p1 TRINITY_DN1356_c0_g1~~TRINITY_DN1356_c0_g1_i1.p1  ORF type:complete len:410 (-),score=106.96 TRINITY_DN1356_c0_g1_i1:743-1972(-)
MAMVMTKPKEDEGDVSPSTASFSLRMIQCLLFLCFVAGLFLFLPSLLPLSQPVPRTGSSASSGANKFVVGYIYLTAPSDLGWTFKQDQARVLLDNKMKNVTSVIAKDVSPANFKEVAVKMITTNGAKLIVAGAPDYQTQVEEVADLYTDVFFFHIYGTTQKKNLVTTGYRLQDVFFMGGVVAAFVSKTKRATFVAAMDSSGSRRAAVAFAIGARRYAPGFKTYFMSNQKWSDSVRTRKQVDITRRDYDSDVFTGIDSNLVLSEAAANAGVFSFGFPSDFARVLHGDNVYGACDLNWFVVFPSSPSPFPSPSPFLFPFSSPSQPSKRIHRTTTFEQVIQQVMNYNSTTTTTVIPTTTTTAFNFSTTTNTNTNTTGNSTSPPPPPTTNTNMSSIKVNAKHGFSLSLQLRGE